MNKKGAASKPIGMAIVIIIGVLFLLVIIGGVVDRLPGAIRGIFGLTNCENVGGTCLPVCPPNWNKYRQDSGRGSTCEKNAKNDPRTDSNIDLKPDILSFVIDDEYLSKQYYDESRWTTCCIKQ